MGNPLVEGSRRWNALIHYEAEELRVHYRATIPRDTARHVVLDLLASGRVPPDAGHPAGDSTSTVAARAAALLGDRAAAGRDVLPDPRHQ